MARVITPSGDEVRTVYSSGGFAAGDYVFQTSAGYEKCSVLTTWPIKASSTWASSQSPIPLGFGYVSSTDLLIGPSQTGGVYAGGAISAGATRLSNTSTTLSSSSSFEVARLSNGHFVVMRGTGTSATVQVFDATFTTTYASFTSPVGLTSYKLHPDGSGGCIINFTWGTYYQGFTYLANTSGNSYEISSWTQASYYNTNWYTQGPNVLIVRDGLFYYAGTANNIGGGYLQMAKFTYTPGSSATPSLVGASTNNGSYNIAYCSLAMTRTSFGTNNPYFYVIGSDGSTNFLAYDSQVATSATTPNISFGPAGWGSGGTLAVGIPTYIKGPSTPNYGALVIPYIKSAGLNIEFYVFPVDSSGYLTTSGAYTTVSTAVSTSSMVNQTAGYFFGVTTTSSVTASSYPDLAFYYAKYNGTISFPCMRTITGPLNFSPTISAEISLNSTTPTSNPGNAIARFDPSSGLIYGTGSAATVTVQGLAAGSITSPQPFAYGNSFTPGQTGTCVGVALTAASAGGTGKILTRGTAEVRSALPNVPGALSFNHANYGTPGGIRGSVVGRTVTFEGIDG